MAHQIEGLISTKLSPTLQADDPALQLFLLLQPGKRPPLHCKDIGSRCDGNSTLPSIHGRGDQWIESFIPHPKILADEADQRVELADGFLHLRRLRHQTGRASCRESVCRYV